MQQRLLVYAVFAITAGGVTANSTNALPASGSNEISPAARIDQSYAQNQRRHAQSMYRAEKFAQAANQLKSLINSGSNEACDHYWLGESYYHLGRYADAVAAFRQAAKLDPKMDNAKVRMVEACLATKDLKETRIASSEALLTATDPYAIKQLQIINNASNRKEPLKLIFKPGADAEVPNIGSK